MISFFVDLARRLLQALDRPDLSEAWLACPLMSRMTMGYKVGVNLLLDLNRLFLHHLLIRVNERTLDLASDYYV